MNVLWVARAGTRVCNHHGALDNAVLYTYGTIAAWQPLRWLVSRGTIIIWERFSVGLMSIEITNHH